MNTLAGMALMRAWIFKSPSFLMSALMASSWCIAPEVAQCDDPIVPDVTTESIPVSNIPLPQAVTAPEQKRTSAVYPQKEIVATSWQIDRMILSSGTQKPVQKKSVSADCISAPQGIQLPPSAAPAVASKAVTSHDGNQKPVLGAVAMPQEIVQVEWSIASRTEHPQTVYRTGPAFQADRCPFVNWDFEASDETLDAACIGACSEVAAGETSIGKAQLVSLERNVSPIVDRETLAELQKLTPMPESGPEVTYLTELSQLLQGESNWLFANEGLLNLAPNEGSTTTVSYLDDLNALVGSQTVASLNSDYQNTIALQETPASDTTDTPRIPTNPYTSIAPDQNCSIVGGSGVSALFQSMSSIRVNGLSTAPPSQSRDSVALTAELPRPENKACGYLDSYSPTYYATPARYGAPRPCRNAHVFWHRPLYYEDPNLERCGQTCGCLTTAASVVHFATAITFTPYLIGANHPTSCVQSLPDCPTCHSFDCTAYWPGWSWKGAALQAAAVTGLYFVVP